MRVFGDFLRDQKVTRRRHVPPPARRRESFFRKRERPFRGTYFLCATESRQRTRQRGPPIMGSPFGIPSTMTGQSPPQNHPGRQRPESTLQPNALPRFCGGKRGAADLHPPRRRNRGATTDSTEQERQRSKEQRQCKFAAPSCLCRYFRQIEKRKYIETMGFYARLW